MSAFMQSGQDLFKAIQYERINVNTSQIEYTPPTEHLSTCTLMYPPLTLYMDINHVCSVLTYPRE
jgi:hypothetical protein